MTAISHSLWVEWGSWECTGREKLAFRVRVWFYRKRVYSDYPVLTPPFWMLKSYRDLLLLQKTLGSQRSWYFLSELQQAALQQRSLNRVFLITAPGIQLQDNKNYSDILHSQASFAFSDSPLLCPWFLPPKHYFSFTSSLFFFLTCFFFFANNHWGARRGMDIFFFFCILKENNFRRNACSSIEQKWAWIQGVGGSFAWKPLV